MTDHTYAGHMLAEIKAAAEAATPGPWGSDGSYICTARTEGGTTYVESWNEVADVPQLKNTKFIATTNPATVLAMAKRIEELEREKAEVEAIEGDTLIKMDELSAKVNGLEKDSARYRWLRDHEDPESIDGPVRDMARSMLLDNTRHRPARHVDQHLHGVAVVA